MIEFDHVSVRYDGAAPGSGDTLTDVTFTVPAGEFCLVAGPTGAGKSTLLGLVNGHVPHFTGGAVAGHVRVAGRDTRRYRPRDLADVVGVVVQDPRRGFVTDRVDDELAYTMESLALPPSVMRRRVEDAVDLLGLSELRDRPLATLSGGQQQRVAIGAALTAHPEVLVLDEPTSALDPAAAEEVLAALHRLVHDVGVTVLLAEHRLERVIGDVDSVVLVGADGRVRHGEPAAMMAASPVVPPVVELGRLAGWDPLPLTVRDARRRAGPLRQTLAEMLTAPPLVAEPGAGSPPGGGGPRWQCERLIGGHDGHTGVVGPITASGPAGQITGLMGRNGSGKSTLLWTLAGVLAPVKGSLRIDGQDPATLPPRERRHLVALVPQQPDDLLYLRSVRDELAQADQDAAAPAGTTVGLLTQLAPGIEPGQHPRDLSEGQRLALVLAIQLAARPALLLLDEPTRGLDYPGKKQLTAMLGALAGRGVSVLLASHDVEFVAATCNRVIIVADGAVIADGPAAEVVTASPTYAPQPAKILAPLPLLTVGRVAALLADADRPRRPGGGR